MQQASQPGVLADLLREATVLAQRAQDFYTSAGGGELPETVVQGLEELAVDLRHLRDGIHDVAIDPEDELAVPRLER